MSAPNRCGECPACIRFKRVQQQMLSNLPLIANGMMVQGSHLTDSDVAFYNRSLEENPCEKKEGEQQ